MPAWDKWELLLFNSKILHIASLAAGAGFKLLQSHSTFSTGVSPFSTGSALWMDSSTKATASFSALVGLLSEKGGFHLKGISVPAVGQSLFSKGILVGGLMAVIGTLAVLQGTSPEKKNQLL